MTCPSITEIELLELVQVVQTEPGLMTHDHRLYYDDEMGLSLSQTVNVECLGEVMVHQSFRQQLLIALCKDLVILTPQFAET